MNTNRIKQTFQDVAKKMVEALETDGAPHSIGSVPMIRGGILLPDQASELYMAALDKISEIAGTEETWSKSSVDDVLWEHIENVLKASSEDRIPAITEQAKRIASRFAEAPSKWTVDLLVYGMNANCAGLAFGKLTFFTDELSLVHGLELAECPSGSQMIARLKTTAIDHESAVNRAAGIVDEHLMILNALCLRGQPSSVWVSRLNRAHRTVFVHRTGENADPVGLMGFQARNVWFPLMRAEIETAMKQRGGEKISGMLSSAENEFSRRVLSGYALAGDACVDAHPERSFLMFAVALESVVLGKDTKSELTHQLGNRTAHLIGRDLGDRKQVTRWVSDLYDLRSRIVHRGEYGGVSQTDSGLIRLCCMTALAVLVMSPAFDGFSTNAQLEDWFKDRMLEGPDHFGPVSK